MADRRKKNIFPNPLKCAQSAHAQRTKKQISCGREEIGSLLSPRFGLQTEQEEEDDGDVLAV